LKHIHAEPVSHQRWKDAIIDSVAERGRATPSQVADDIGWTTEEEKHRVSVQMVDLAKRTWLIRESNGIYMVQPKYRQRRNRTLEADIIDTIKQYGGLAQWSEIMGNFEALPSQNKEQPYDGRSYGGRHRIQAAMNNSSLIQHYSISENEGFWGLAPDELLKVALSGRSAEFLAKHQFVMVPESGGICGGERELREDIETHFIRVGMVLRRVRRFYEKTLDIAACQDVKKAVEWAVRRSPELEREIGKEMKMHAKERATAEGHGEDANRLDDLFEEEKNREVDYALQLLEEGSPVAHRAAPAALFYSYGKSFKVCPASLSRGMLVQAAPSERHDKFESKGDWLP
jgi:hypothetical protein